jgi:hypothetical protein
MRDAACVFAVGLHCHGRQCCLDVSRLDQHDLELGRGHPSVQPLGERPGFQADANYCQPEIGQEADQGLCSLAILPSRTIRPVAFITHTLLDCRETSIPA